MNKLFSYGALLFLLVSFQANAAPVYTWTSTPTAAPGDTVAASGSGAFLTADYDFGKASGPVTHTWAFSVVPAFSTDVVALEFFDNQIAVNSVKLNGVSLTDTIFGPLRIWSINSFLTGTNTIVIDIASAVASGQYDIKINPVPIPAAVWLFASGFAAVGFVRRKSQRNQQPV